jgi:alkanesulfonate monooxygenase SsuD/methylene tetrahydromethanopterin reductase-like flavin-dependent oxidoreductase (luciferase family)
MSHPVRFGLKVSGQGTTTDALQTCWRIADEARFDHLWDFDHLAGVKSSGLESPIFDGWSLLPAMAVATQHVRLGCLVTGNTYRHPGVLAKSAVTVDHLSHGRLEFGIGAAWSEAEHAMYGIEGLEHRVGRFSEALQVFKMLWTEDRTTFRGRYYNLKDAIANPKPIQKPYPPIWIGAKGDMTLKLVARHADVWNVTGVKNAGEAAAAGERLHAACEAEGRPYDDIRWSGQIFWDGLDRPKLEADVAGFLENGFTEIVIFPDVRATGVDIVAAATAAAEELPKLRRLSVVVHS